MNELVSEVSDQDAGEIPEFLRRQKLEQEAQEVKQAAEQAEKE